METTDKIEELETLSQVIHDQMLDYDFAKSLKIEDTHHILYSGDVDSKIMLVKMYPDRSELSFAIRDNIHDKYVFTGIIGNKIKTALKKAGFDNSKLFYTNIIPFFPMAGMPLEKKNIHKLIWIFDSIMQIINPKILIVVGFDAFNIIFDGNINKVSYLKLVKDKQLIYPFNNNDYVIAPIASENDTFSSNSIYSIIDRLYVIKDNILKT